MNNNRQPLILRQRQADPEKIKQLAQAKKIFTKLTEVTRDQFDSEFAANGKGSFEAVLAQFRSIASHPKLVPEVFFVFKLSQEISMDMVLGYVQATSLPGQVNPVGHDLEQLAELIEGRVVAMYSPLNRKVIVSSVREGRFHCRRATLIENYRHATVRALKAEGNSFKIRSPGNKVLLYSPLGVIEDEFQEENLGLAKNTKQVNSSEGEHYTLDNFNVQPAIASLYWFGGSYLMSKDGELRNYKIGERSQFSFLQGTVRNGDFVQDRKLMEANGAVCTNPDGSVIVRAPQ